MLGAVFMATDMVASPMTNLGSVLYGVLIGLLVVLIRVWGGMPEGVMYAILIANAAAPHIDNWIQPRVYGTAAGGAPLSDRYAPSVPKLAPCGSLTAAARPERSLTSNDAGRAPSFDGFHRTTSMPLRIPTIACSMAATTPDNPNEVSSTASSAACPWLTVVTRSAATIPALR